MSGWARSGVGMDWALHQYELRLRQATDPAQRKELEEKIKWLRQVYETFRK